MLRYHWKVALLVLVIALKASSAYAKGELFYQELENCKIKLEVINQNRTLSFVNIKGNILNTYETNDGFVTGFIFESNRFITIWETGSALKTVIFVINENSVVNILTLSSYSPPEIVDIDNDGEFELVIWEGKFMTSGKKIIERPKQATIYKFNGSDYANIGTRPWESRFTGGRVLTSDNAK